MELTTRMTDIVADERKYLVHVELVNLYAILWRVTRTNSAANTLEMMQVFAGSSFDILDG